MTTPIPDPAAGDWHLDKRIPVVWVVTLFIAILGQSITIGWWASGVNRDLSANTADITAQDRRLAAVEAAQTAQAVNNAVLTQQLTSLREGMSELKSSQAEMLRIVRSLSIGKPVE